jgi:hypothetical protein
MNQHPQLPLESMSPDAAHETYDAAVMAHRGVEQQVQQRSLAARFRTVGAVLLASGAFAAPAHAAEQSPVSVAPGVHASQAPEAPTAPKGGPEKGNPQEAKYQAAQVAERNFPFKSRYTARERELYQQIYAFGHKKRGERLFQKREQSEQKLIQTRLEQYDAELVTAVQLPSGIKANFYKSNVDTGETDFTVDPKAYSMFMDRVIKNMQNIPGSPVNAEMKAFAQKAKKGEVDLTLNIMVVSDPNLCLPLPLSYEESITTPDYVSATDTTNCKAIGYNDRIIDPLPAKNQFIVVLNPGSRSTRSWYDPTAIAQNRFLPTEQSTALVAAHESAHSIVAYAYNGRLLPEDEHNKIVFPTESRTYNNFCTLAGPGQQMITPNRALEVNTPFHFTYNIKPGTTVVSEGKGGVTEDDPSSQK